MRWDEQRSGVGRGHGWGWVVGLGDRAPRSLLYDARSGQLLHARLHSLLETARTLPLPPGHTAIVFARHAAATAEPLPPAPNCLCTADLPASPPSAHLAALLHARFSFRSPGSPLRAAGLAASRHPAFGAAPRPHQPSQ